MNPTPATVPFAPVPSPTKITADTLEHHLGAIVAAAGMAIAEALQERADGALSPRTRQRGGDLICELVRWRRFLIADYPGFDGLAREHGVAALRAVGVSSATAVCLVDEALNLMAKVTRIALN